MLVSAYLEQILFVFITSYFAFNFFGSFCEDPQFKDKTVKMFPTIFAFCAMTVCFLLVAVDVKENSFTEESFGWILSVIAWGVTFNYHLSHLKKCWCFKNTNSPTLCVGEFSLLARVLGFLFYAILLFQYLQLLLQKDLTSFQSLLLLLGVALFWFDIIFYLFTCVEFKVKCTYVKDFVVSTI